MIPGRGRFAFHIPPESVFTSLRNPYSQFPGTLIHMLRNTQFRSRARAGSDLGGKFLVGQYKLTRRIASLKSSSSKFESFLHTFSSAVKVWLSNPSCQPSH